MILFGVSLSDILSCMRVFKYKRFHRWAEDEGISENTLWGVAKEVVLGRFEADLGKYLFKKRIPQHNSGKSNGFRVLVGLSEAGFQQSSVSLRFCKKRAIKHNHKRKAGTADCFPSICCRY